MNHSTKWRGFTLPSRKRIGKLEEQNAYDRLTGFLKLQAFEKEVLLRMEKMFHKQCVNDTRSITNSVAIVFLDIDNFGEVNDATGSHDEGDEILRILAEVVRDADLVARRSDGADEFLIAFFGASKEGAGVAVVEMRKRFEAAVLEKFQNFEFHVSFSFEIELVYYLEDKASLGASIKNAISLADEGMYIRKRARKAGCTEAE